MVAVCNRADHYIFALWFLSSVFSSPNLSGWEIGCLPYIHSLCIVKTDACVKCNNTVPYANVYYYRTMQLW